MTYIKLLSIAAAVTATSGGLIGAEPAYGQKAMLVTAPDVVRRHVGYADLNLASMAGETALNLRVRGAVKDVCQEAIAGADDGGTQGNLQALRCENSAWADARPQIERAARRAREIASLGTSSIAGAAITIAIPK